jgi:predicted amidohydrolase YtcJ
MPKPPDRPGLTRRPVLGGLASGLAGTLAARPTATGAQTMSAEPDLILVNGRVTTLDRTKPEAEALAVRGGRIHAVGAEAEIRRLAGAGTEVIDCGGRRVIPGLQDNHIHVIRGGLNFNMELRWDGVPSLADGMRMLKEQVARTPPPQWVRVVGGFTEHQFAEKRMPTLDEINAVAPDTPVFILHLYDRALLNGAALRAVGYDRDTPEPPGGQIERDGAGNPTGLLLANPNAQILYATLAKGPKLPLEYQVNSTRHFMRDLNRLGVTSVIDAGGGYQNYPEDYEVIQKMHAEGLLTLRLAYNLFTQKPKAEKDDFLRWTSQATYKQGDDYLRLNGAGEMLVFSAADFEDFRVERPDMPPTMEEDLEGVVRILAQNRWPWRLHATYDETITRALDVFEKVNQEIPLQGLNWFFDHAETISDRSIDRIARLGGGVAVQHRMAYQGEYFVERYGPKAAERTPPFKKILDAGVKVSAGTDATRVASYDPWVSLSWLVTGKTLGGLSLYPQANLLDREEALRMWTEYPNWFCGDEGNKGQIKVGQWADIAVLSADYFSVPAADIRQITSVLTLLAGKPVYGAGEYAGLAPPPPPPMPDWSPVRSFGGYHKHAAGPRRAEAAERVAAADCSCGTACSVHGHAHASAWGSTAPVSDLRSFWGALGCACWAV